MTSPGAIAFSIFGFDIMWYGILIATGFITAILLSYKRAPSHGIESESIIDFVIWMMPISIIGARAYYVLFSWDLYRGDLASMLDIRGGGLAIHGGLIAGILTAVVFTHRRKISLLDLADVILPTVALAQAIGRWGNFFNSEAHGSHTDLPWGILVNGDTVHPTFLYESIWCLFLFLFLIWLDRKPGFPGRLAFLYGMLYSLERFFVEGLRTDSLMIGPFRQAQLLSATVLIACLVAYVIQSRKYKGVSK